MSDHVVSWLAESEMVEWDAFVENSLNGTFLHTRRFLGYHGSRFRDMSLTVRSAEGRLLAVMPAAISAADSSTIVTHPGATFGGLVWDGQSSAADIVEYVRDIAAAFANQGYERLVYRAVPPMYHRFPAQDDTYALFRLEARRSRVDLSTAFQLSNRGRVSQLRRRGLRRCERLGGRFREAMFDEYWPVLEEVLATRHGVDPTHSLSEIEHLRCLFPARVKCHGIFRGEVLTAGAVSFVHDRLWHTQYLASSTEGREMAAMDLLIESLVGLAAGAGAEWFDFGISTEHQGRQLNSGLHQFKQSFGAGSTLYETFTLDLNCPETGTVGRLA